MHREFVVAIQTKIANSNFTDFRRRFCQRETDEIVAFSTMTSAVLGHRELPNDGEFLGATDSNVKKGRSF